MDFIGTLADTLGVDADMAQAVAGTVLGMARDQVGDEETAKLNEAVPEIDGWQSMANSVLSQASSEESSGSGGLFGAIANLAGSGLGNELVGAVMGEDAQEAATVVGLMSKLGLKTGARVDGGSRRAGLPRGAHRRGVDWAHGPGGSSPDGTGPVQVRPRLLD